GLHPANPGHRRNDPGLAGHARSFTPPSGSPRGSIRGPSHRSAAHRLEDPLPVALAFLLDLGDAPAQVGIELLTADLGWCARAGFSCVLVRRDGSTGRRGLARRIGWVAPGSPRGLLPSRTRTRIPLRLR